MYNKHPLAQLHVGSKPITSPSSVLHIIHPPKKKEREKAEVNIVNNRELVTSYILDWS